jgi:hypothetical protein
MLRAMRVITSVFVGLCLTAGTVRAQWGGWWGGWGAYGGGGTTTVGDMARGMGAMYAGVGAGNVMDAQAANINSQTMQQWSDWMWSAQNNVNRHYMERTARERRENLENFNAIQDRIRKNPNASDITSGNALNAAMQDLTNPKTMRATMSSAAKLTLSSQLVRRIRWFYASDAVTFSLYNLTSDKNWPSELKRPEFDTDRKAFITAIEKALDEDYKGEVSDATRDEIRKIVQDAWAKVEQVYPVGTVERARLERRFKTFKGMLNLLKGSDIGPALAQLEKVPQVSLADVIAFAETFNLRFGAAQNDGERAANREMFMLLDQVRDEVTKGQDMSAVAQAPPPPTAHAEELLEKVQPGGVNAPPQPR